MRIFRVVLSIVVTILIATAVAGTVAYLSVNKRNAAQPVAVAAMVSDEVVTVSQPDDQDWLVFSPTGESPTTGLIIYPGGFVDPAAYAPIARDIAERGYLVVIDPMPLNLAVLGVEGASRIIAAYPNVSGWAIGGHSLGGAMAAEFVANNPGAVDGLALWAAYPAQGTSLRDLAIEAVSIYGDADGVAAIADVREGANRLPPDAQLIVIPGGNHTQFGRYGRGLQRGDNPAGITPDDQQAIIVGTTVDLMSHLGASS
jgi:dienelactone hydrolase